MDRPDAPRADRRRLTHVDRRGRPRMVDVGAKPATARRAVAEAEVTVSPETMSLVIDGGGAKGDVLTVAEASDIPMWRAVGTCLLGAAETIMGLSDQFKTVPGKQGLCMLGEAGKPAATGVPLRAASV